MIESYRMATCCGHCESSQNDDDTTEDEMWCDKHEEYINICGVCDSFEGSEWFIRYSNKAATPEVSPGP